MLTMEWARQASERSNATQRSKERIEHHARLLIDACRRLIAVKGDEFTTQELVTEAGVALQTFYRYFGSKDYLLLAVLNDAMSEACARWRDHAPVDSDPLSRLRFYLTATLERLFDGSHDVASTRFIVSAHWRLHRLHPKELEDAERPFVDLLREELDAAVADGSIRSGESDWNAWFLAETVRAVYHYYAYATTDETYDVVSERLWTFCSSAIGYTDS